MDNLFISSLGKNIGTGHTIRTIRFIKYLSFKRKDENFYHIILKMDSKISFEKDKFGIKTFEFNSKKNLIKFLRNTNKIFKNIFLDIGLYSKDLENELIHFVNDQSVFLVVDDSFEFEHIKKAKIVSQDLNSNEIEKDIFKGLSYSLINPPKSKILRDNLKNISIFLGGTDILNLTSSLFDKLEKYANDKSIYIDFILNKNSNFNNLSPKLLNPYLNIYSDLEDIYKIIEKSDFMITTPGMTAIEAIAHWCPVGLIQNNHNQENIIEYLLSSNCCLLVDNSFGTNSLNNFLDFKLPSNKELLSMSKNCSKLSISNGFDNVNKLLSL